MFDRAYVFLGLSMVLIAFILILLFVMSFRKIHEGSNPTESPIEKYIHKAEIYMGTNVDRDIKYKVAFMLLTEEKEKEKEILIKDKEKEILMKDKDKEIESNSNYFLAKLSSITIRFVIMQFTVYTISRAN